MRSLRSPGLILTKFRLQLICLRYFRCDGRTFFQLVCLYDITGKACVTEGRLRLLGDLGVQRGLLRWFLSLRSPDYSFGIAPEKVGGSRETKLDEGDLPSVSNGESIAMDVEPSSAFPGSSRQTDDTTGILPAFIPSAKTALRKSVMDSGKVPRPLPVGLDVATMKSRLKGKKAR